MIRKIAICGGGTSLGHALTAVLAANPENEVRVWTRQPHRWGTKVRAIYLDIAEIGGAPAVVSAEPGETVAGAELVLVCLPFPARRAALKQMAPYLMPTAWVGGIPGFAGFDWEARAVFGPGTRLFGLQRVPYVRKTISYGEAVWISGIRPRLFLAALPSNQTAELAQRIEELLSIPTTALSTYLPVSLSASNAIFHPARLLAAFAEADPFAPHERKAQFYEEWDDASSVAYIGMDEDVQRIARALDVSPSEAVPIMEHFHASTIGEMTDRIRGISALRDRALPVTGSDGNYRLDPASPYVTEDACFALVVLRSMADLARVETPWLDRGVRWAESVTGRRFLRNGKIDGPDVLGLPTPSNCCLPDAFSLVQGAS